MGEAGPDELLQTAVGHERPGLAPHAALPDELTSLPRAFYELAEVEEISGARLPPLLDQEPVHLPVQASLEDPPCLSPGQRPELHLFGKPFIPQRCDSFGSS